MGKVLYAEEPFRATGRTALSSTSSVSQKGSTLVADAREDLGARHRWIVRVVVL